MQFSPLIEFTSREFGGSHYVPGLTYTVRPGNDKLLAMVQRWLQAKIFMPLVDFEVMGMQFTAGKPSYVLPGDDLELVIDAKVGAQQADYISFGLITLDVPAALNGTITGAAVNQGGV